MDLPLWPDGVPGALESASYGDEYTELPDGNAAGAHRRKVSVPRLQVFLPEASVATGSAVVICPGGGYELLSDQKEGETVARWLCAQGIAAMVLRYRLPSPEIMTDPAVGPLQDAQEAIRLVRRRAAEWKLDPARIAMMGFSAGGHLAATASTLFQETLYAADPGISARPDRTVLIYPVISMDPAITHEGSCTRLLGTARSAEQVTRFSADAQITAETPRAFILHSADDASVPLANSLRYAAGLERAGVPVELHVFPTGGHGYGMEVALGASPHWPMLLLDWLRAQGW